MMYNVCRLYISELEGPSDSIALGHEAALDTSGIFNMRWTPGDWHLGSNPKLALANSAGEISLVERSLGDDKASANEVVSKSMFESSMAVSLAISSQHKIIPWCCYHSTLILYLPFIEIMDLQNACAGIK